MPSNRETLGSDVALEAFQLFRILGFDSLAKSLNLDADEQGVLQAMAGTAMGRSLVRRGSVQGSDLAALLQSFTGFYQKMGLGVVSMRTEGQDLLVSIAECAGCAGSTPGGQAICFVEAGMLRGLVSEITGRDYLSQEEKCIGGLGDIVCEFRLVEVR